MSESRSEFEAHILSLNVCTRLARQSESIGGFYRTTTVQRAWELWKASRRAALEQAAKLCDSLNDGYEYGAEEAAVQIRSLAQTKAQEG